MARSKTRYPVHDKEDWIRSLSHSITDTHPSREGVDVPAASTLSNAESPDGSGSKILLLESVSGSYPTRSRGVRVKGKMSLDRHGQEDEIKSSEVGVTVPAKGSSISAELGSTESSGGSSHSGTSMKRKRVYGKHKDGAHEENDDDYYDFEDGKSSSSKRQNKSVLRFACPYFKHSPIKYGASRTCNGPGWPSVFRVKEHIYRRHMRTHRCSRCDQERAEAPNSHLQAEAPCECIGSEDDGIDQATAAELKRRPNKYNQTEAQRWADMFQIIFPECPSDIVPSPYHDQQESLHDTQNRIFKSLKNELPQLIAGSIREHPSIAEAHNLSSLEALISKNVDTVWTRFTESSGTTAPQSEALSKSPRTPITESSLSTSLIPTFIEDEGNDELWENLLDIAFPEFPWDPKDPCSFEDVDVEYHPLRIDDITSDINVKSMGEI